MSRHSTCIVEGCERKSHARGLCQSHRRCGKSHVIQDLNPVEKIAFVKYASQSSSDECIEWRWGKDGNGYGQICYRHKTTTPHRLNLFFAIGPPTDETKKDALHSCDNPSCCNAKHLRYGNQLDNMRECKAKNRHAFGERAGASKLAEQQVVEIRRLYSRRRVTQ